MTTAGSTTPRRIVFLTANPQAPSFHYRLAPVMPLLAAMGWECEIEVLPERRYGWRIWTRRNLLRDCAAVVLHKLRLTTLEVRWLHRLCPATLFDVDDAIWLRQPKWVGHQRPVSPRRLSLFEAMCRSATVTVVGNQVLAAKAQAAGGRVRIVPTPIDATAYPPPDVQRAPGRVLVWVGMPGNLQYLEPLRPVLVRLAQRHPGLVLRVISSDWPAWDDVTIERMTWSAATEKAAMVSVDVGIMPLSDDDFARGKCAFKLLQYMAAGLPCVASPVGANCEVVLPCETGFLASTPAEWERALDRLLGDPDVARAMGLRGRQRALEHYDMGLVSPRVARLVDQVARRQPLTPPPAAA
jgi:glycosyltransferase involved in cell wall biosynthesis